MAKITAPEKPGFALNPASGSVLTAPAGGQTEAGFDFTNDSPDVAAFELAVEGLPAEWLGGVGSASGAMAAASSGGSLRLTLAPSLGAPEGDYKFSVRIISEGDDVAPPTALVLRVEPPVIGASVAVVQESAFTAPPAADLPAPKAAPRRRPAPEKTPTPVVDVVPVPTAVPDPIPVAVAPVPVAPLPVIAAPKPIPPQPAPRAAQIQPTPRPAAPPPPPPEPEYEPEPLLVDYQPTPVVQEEDKESEEQEEEPSTVDLPDGSAIALKPGETRLLRFAFTNDTSRDVTYVLDEDRSLPDEWITLVQDQVNLTRNGKGDVSLRLSPPLNAEPGDYHFSVTLGPQGGNLTSRALTLTVQATPAVKLTSKEQSIKIGAFSSFADFHLTVESVGNADTAFRIAVKAPQTEAVEGQAHTPSDVYETPQWRYLFDKELESLRAPATGRTPRPVPIRLRLQRKGFWWFGFREVQHVRVAAVPVTEPSNSGKPDNSVEVTAIRQRFWPMPYLTIIPLLLILLMLGSGGASDLSVSEGKYQYHDAATNAYWVASPGAQKDVGLEWTAPKTALLRMTGSLGTTPVFSHLVMGSGKDTEKVTMNSSERSQTYNYQVSRLIGGGDCLVSVRFVQTSSVTPLAVDDSAGHPLPGTEVTLDVPVGKIAKLTLKNDATTDNALNYWVVKPLNTQSNFKWLYGKNEGSIEWHQSNVFPIVSSGKVGDTDQIVFVTTDARKPVLTVNLKMVAH